MRSIRPLALTVAIAAVAVVLVPFAVASSQSVTLTPGDQLTATCSSTLNVQATTNQAVLTCATVVPTATPVPASMVGVCGESMDQWHPPVINGCATGHEHGDAPPQWIMDAGYQVSFHGHFNTSPLENTAKHAAMKGFAAHYDNGVDFYVRVHANSNPLDRSARYHSFEAWARDPGGNVSHWQGWYNTGDPNDNTTGRVPRSRGDAPRPVIEVVDATAFNLGITCEQWYTTPSDHPATEWAPIIDWNICSTTTLYKFGENATASDQSTWVAPPFQTFGNHRELELTWFNIPGTPRGKFWATQFGDLVSGPTDPQCSQTTVKYGVSYQTLCLDQYIAPTMIEVAFDTPGTNFRQKDFDVTGVHVPN